MMRPFGACRGRVATVGCVGMFLVGSQLYGCGGETTEDTAETTAEVAATTGAPAEPAPTPACPLTDSPATKSSACDVCASEPDKCFDTWQAMWTVHCLQDGDATFPPTLTTAATDIIVQKGTNKYVDAYSAFMDNTKTLKTELDDTLKANEITKLYVAGIATDVCVFFTAMDGIDLGYEVVLIEDASAGIAPSAITSAIETMEANGAVMTTSTDILAMDCPDTPPKHALLLIDVQDCFLDKDTTSGDAGTLPVTDAHKIIPIINSIRAEKSCLFDKVVRSQDFHPADHISFGPTHGLPPFYNFVPDGTDGIPITCIKPDSGMTSDAACCPKLTCPTPDCVGDACFVAP